MSSAKRVISCALLLAALCGGVSRAADVETPAIQPSPATSVYSVLTYGLRNPKCTRWTDRCIVCTQNGCSNIGIACQPQDVICTDPPPEAGK